MLVYVSIQILLVFLPGLSTRPGLYLMFYQQGRDTQYQLHIPLLYI